MDAWGGGGSSVDVGASGVSIACSVGMVISVTANEVGVASLVGLGTAVGTLPTGFRTFLRYVFPTSYRHATRSLMDGNCKRIIANTRMPAPVNKMFLFDMLGVYQSWMNPK